MRRLRTALVAAIWAIMIALILQKTIIRDVLGFVELRREPDTMTLSAWVALALVGLLLGCAFALTAIDNAIWRRANNRTEGVNSDAEPLAKE